VDVAERKGKVHRSSVNFLQKKSGRCSFSPSRLIGRGEDDVTKARLAVGSFARSKNKEGERISRNFRANNTRREWESCGQAAPREEPQLSEKGTALPHILFTGGGGKDLVAGVDRLGKKIPA